MLRIQGFHMYVSKGISAHYLIFITQGHILQVLEFPGEHCAWKGCFWHQVFEPSSGNCSLVYKGHMSHVGKYFAGSQALKLHMYKSGHLPVWLNMDLRATFGEYSFFNFGLNSYHLDVSILQEYFIAFFLPKSNSTTCNTSFYEALQAWYCWFSCYMKLNLSIQWTITGKNYRTYYNKLHKLIAGGI